MLLQIQQHHTKYSSIIFQLLQSPSVWRFRPHRLRRPWFLASRGSTHPLSGQSCNTHLCSVTLSGMINQGINICNHFVAWCSAVECSSRSSLPEFPPTSTCLNKIVKYDQVPWAKIVVGKCDSIWYFAHLINLVFLWSNSKISCWEYTENRRTTHQ